MEIEWLEVEEIELFVPYYSEEGEYYLDMDEMPSLLKLQAA